MTHINREVDLPEELISAQQEGRLVIFAGAGVSRGSPSNLPSFRGLAEEIGAPTYTPNDGEPLDRFLGRVESEGVKVQERTRRIIDDPDSEPTPLHEHLLELFRNSAAVRLVTTNFDRHFTTIVRDRFEDGVEIYYAPALPLGTDVDGVIYMHGAVEKPNQDLILTDGDFGRAYLTERWAPRFLVRLFQNYTVLFVGYGHNDPVMQYLARGLVPGTSRYALTPRREDDHWHHLGITPVHYPLRSDPDDHSALTDAVEAWVDDANRGELEHANRIRRLVQDVPPLEPHLADYLRASLSDPTRLRFFTRHAEDPEWLWWADREGAFETLFGSVGPVDETDRILAWWFSDRFIVEHPADALGLISRKDQRMGPELWFAIVQRLRSDPNPPATILTRWVALLVDAAPPGAGRHLTYLLADRNAEERDAILLLFRHLTRPRISLDSPFGPVVDSDDDGQVRIRAEIDVEANEHFFREAWTDELRPSLAQLQPELALIVADHLAEAHRLLVSAGAATSDWDSMSLLRSAIEPHEQDRLTRPIDLLIDAGRDVLCWCVRERRSLGRSLIEQWARADAPLLQRLAIHGLVEDPTDDPDWALERIMSESWLYKTPLKHEVFRLLKESYPAATEEERRKFLEFSMDEDVIERDGESPDASGRIAYERYNVAVWLHRVAPECPLAEEHLERLQEANPDFEPRPHPDLSAYMEVGATYVAPQGPVSVEELLERPAPEWLDYLVEYEGDEVEPWLGATDRQGLLENVSKAIQEEPGWGCDLAEAAEDEGVWKPDIWQSILAGWAAAEQDEELWARMAGLLHRNAQLDAFDRPVAKLLEEGVKSEDFPSERLSDAEEVADRIFEEVVASEEAVSDTIDGNWLTRAINHIGGRIALIWLSALSRRRRAAGDDWTGLPQEYRRRFSGVLEPTSEAERLARIVLASQFTFLHYVDSDWTAENLLPLFDWERDKRAAEQAWHGFLTWGRLNAPVVEALFPYMRRSFDRIGHELEPHRRSFCRKLASIALGSKIHPLESSWLPAFITEADEESRVSWASAVKRQLGEMEADGIEAVWRRWMKEYWQERLTGSPKPFSHGEVRQMVNWALALGPVFEEGVDLVCRMDVQFSEDDDLLFALERGDLPETKPEATGQLFEHMLSSAETLSYGCRFAEPVTKRLMTAGAGIEILHRICNHLARLGCAGAQKLCDELDYDE